MAIRADVSNYAEARSMVEKVLTQFGRVDILVNNAGIGDVKQFTEITENDWDRIVAVNLKSVFNCARAVVGGMIARRSGRIISISSVAGLTGTPSHVHYSATKGGIVAFTKALAKEVGQYGITVNAIAPGIVKTGFGRGAPESIKQLYKEKTVLGRVGNPEEIAAACLYLASEDGSYITGQVLSPPMGDTSYKSFSLDHGESRGCLIPRVDLPPIVALVEHPHVITLSGLFFLKSSLQLKADLIQTGLKGFFLSFVELLLDRNYGYST